jgi:hypothetical protein
MNLLIAKIQTTAVLAVVQAAHGPNGPNIHPSYNGPGMHQIKILLAVFLGFVALLCAVFFFVNLAKVAGSSGSNEKNAGRGIIGMVVCAIAFALVIGGTQTLYGWSAFFS